MELQERKWNRKRIMIAATLLLLAVALFGYILLAPKVQYADIFSQPTIANNSKAPGYVITQATFDTHAYSDFHGDIVYEDDEYVHVFDHQGYYKGNYFRDAYVDEKGDIKMRVSANITPNDGVVESFLIVKISGDDVIAKIYIDSDWKQLIGDPLVLYGFGFVNQTKFDGTEVKPGLFEMILTQPTAKDYKKTAPRTPYLNIALSDRNRFQIFYGDNKNVTMIVYK